MRIISPRKRPLVLTCRLDYAYDRAAKLQGLNARLGHLIWKF